jgi:hypothetical protein
MGPQIRRELLPRFHGRNAPDWPTKALQTKPVLSEDKTHSSFAARCRLMVNELLSRTILRTVHGPRGRMPPGAVPDDLRRQAERHEDTFAALVA